MVLPPGWSKKWDNLGRARVVYGAENTPEEVESKVAQEELRAQLSRMPSWVPNWAFPALWDPEPLIDSAHPTQQYRASGDTIPRLHSSPDSYRLSLDGIIFDEIQYLAHPWCDKGLLQMLGLEKWFNSIIIFFGVKGP
jgi:hypothetical protein